MTTEHDCIKSMNEGLKPYNTQLSMAIDFSGKNRELIQLATVKADNAVRKKPASVFASYCPFCGVKLAGGAA
jgi:hypothetical protein